MPQRVPTGPSRPRTEPTAADVRNIEKWASEGCAIIEIARALKVSTDLVSRWRKDHPAVNEALEAGKAVEHRALRSRAFEIALNEDGKYDDRTSATMVQWLLATRHSYRDRGDEQGHTSGVNVNITLPGSRPLSDYIIEASDGSSRTERLSAPTARTARGG
jgi:hypothetical protein